MYLIGPPGCGKTRQVYDTHDINDIYKLNTNSMVHYGSMDTQTKQYY